MVNVLTTASAPKFNEPGVTVSLGCGAVVVVVGLTLLVLLVVFAVVVPPIEVVVVAAVVVVLLPAEEVVVAAVVVVVDTDEPLRATGVPVSRLKGGLVLFLSAHIFT